MEKHAAKKTAKYDNVMQGQIDQIKADEKQQIDAIKKATQAKLDQIEADVLAKDNQMASLQPAKEKKA